SGRTSTKGINSDYLRVTPDSTRIYVNEGAGKSRLGGFAVSGRTSTKGFLNDYFNVSGVGATGLNIIDPSEPRMLWYPKSEAFLVGRVIIEDPDSVGLNSISTGYESKAIGDYSHALGYQSIARNNYSTAIGKNAVADGESSYAFGDNAFTKISADNSYAIGTNATAQGSNSYAFGNGTIANGNGSFAFGAGGRDSTGVAISEATIAEGDNAFAMGLGATAYGVNSFSIGTSTSAHGENAFALGLGTIATGKYSTAMGYQNTASGKGSMAWGGYRSYSVDYSNEASGDVSTAWGIKTTASGRNSTAWGEANEASGRNSTAWGGYNISRSYATTAWGWNCEALERYNTAFGWGAKAKAYTSTAAGIGTAATSYGSFVIGRSNDTIYNHTDINYYDNRTPESYMLWFDDDPLFVVGNGWNHPLVGNKNALTVLKNGTTIVGWNTSVDNSEINPDARYNLSVKVPYDNGFIFYVHGQAGGTSSWNEISDIRLKQNIKTIDGALDKVLKLRGVTFEWKDKERKGLNIGFIAQEAKEILPEVVTGSEETKYSMQYAPITAVLVEAMKEQQNEIEQLKEQNKLLLDRLKKIEEKLEK
ncbi:MAG TPA: tail fiber domain-containing protein, partial [Bacteroidales bacterium]|nr:tail fiber domain-containing protein [Bacteroidales bacterium]